MIKAGDSAPDFTLPVSTGGTLTLSGLRPRRVVLYFYPKDMTEACTAEALDFSALAGGFAAAGASVVGVSRDSLRRHANFTARHGLQVALCSDVDGSVCESWGVWGEKQMYGRTFMGIIRSTFLVGPDGRVEQVWSPVRVRDHAAEVLKAVRTAGSVK